MQRIFRILLAFFFMSILTSTAAELPLGIWRGVLKTQGKEIPFNFTVEQGKTKNYTVIIHNAEERLRLDEVTVKSDSVQIVMGVFESEIRAKLVGKKLIGVWKKQHPTRPYELPFEAEAGVNTRFEVPAEEEITNENVDGTYAVDFKDKQGGLTKAVGVFKQTGHKVTGTFLTTTGDYRYLEGNFHTGTLRLSCFDGSHAYLFEAQFSTVNNQKTLTGNFWAGKSGHETWTATFDPNAKLPEASSITGMKPGKDRLDFTFPDLQGKPVSLSDARFKNKVVVVQLLGSWCPNCMDETAYLAPFYKANKQKGLEIVGLGYEYSPEFDKAKARLEKLKARFQIEYPLLVAGTADKTAAAQGLSSLKSVEAFPTTIIIDKKGKVREVHTGFSGPGTGKYYEEWKASFEKQIAALLVE
jgi:peroxiredoxin